MAPREPWERVWIDAETFAQDVHARINCTECHGGQAVDDMALAHTDMIARPAADAATCGDCHPDVGPANAMSLHTTLRGYDTVLADRSLPEHTAVLEEMETYHCNSCHTTCGDCHVSQPESVGGGLLDGHVFVGTPPMTQTCTACHGSRVQNEYFGLNEGVPSDVHFRARMGCVECHSADEIHGIGQETAAHRYDGEQMPACAECHEDQVGIGSGIEQHEIHGTEILSCQACHSTSYTNCTNCHVERTEDDAPFFRVESHSLGFYLGRNPLRSVERPYRYVPVRHVPIDVNSFSFYGDNLMPNFDSRPTWVYSTPHNIQRVTPQTESCESCHGNDDVFLTADKVDAAELAANVGVIVEQAPPLPEGYAPSGVGEEPAAPGGGDDFWGDGAPAATEAPSGGDGFWGGEDAPPATTEPTGDDAFWGDSSEAAPTETPADDEAAFWGDS